VSLTGSWFHDQVHRHPSRRTLGGRLLMRLGSAPVGLSPLWWSYKHVRLHHRYPSDPRYDPDIQFGAIGRVVAEQPWRRPHRYQHYYMWVLLPFSTINMLKPAESVQARKYSKATGISSGFPIRALYLDKYLPLLGFWSAFTFVVGPRRALICFVGTQLTAGLLVSLITQVQHNTLLTRNVPTDVPAQFACCRQIFLSSDVGDRRNLWWWLCGGVSFHSVHHLIPTLDYRRTPAATHRLRATMSELGYSLPSHPGLFAAISSHGRLIRELSQRDPSSPGGSVEPGSG
jgi:linoleoyl-CoA desaturase